MNVIDKIEKNFRLEKSIGWQIAIVKKINQFNTIIETEDKSEGVIEYKEVSWTKKDFKDLLKKGDVIYVKKINKNLSEKLTESDISIIKKMINKLSTKEITEILSQITNVPKKEIYNYCLELKNEK